MKTLTFLSIATLFILTSCNQADEYICYCTNATGAVNKKVYRPDDPNFQERKTQCKASTSCEWLPVND